MRILILHSDIPEHASIDEEDTLQTARAIQAACAGLGWQASLLACSAQLVENPRLIPADYDVIFNLTESMEGRSHLSYQGALVAQSSGIPYTGGTPLNIWFTTNKILTKQMLRACHIPTPNWLMLHNDMTPLIHALQQGALIVKPVAEDASIGISQDSYVSNELELTRFLQQKDPQVTEWFAEQYIAGREFNVCIWQQNGEVNILPIKELQFKNWPSATPKIYGYTAKWQEKSAEYINIVNVFDFSAAEQPLLENLTAIALQCWQLLQLKGYVRLDIRVDEQGQPWVLEINVNPDITVFFACASRVGYSYPQMIKAIVEEALLSRQVSCEDA